VVTAAALIAPRPLLISNTGDTFATAEMQAVYAAVSGCRCKVTATELAPEALAEWFRSQNGVVDSHPHGAEFFTWDGQTCGYEGHLTYS
jgi:hypothetical protein